MIIGPGGQIDVTDRPARQAGVVSVANFDIALSALRDALETIQIGNFPATQPVSGPLTDAQLRANTVPISGTLTANQGSAGSADWKVKDSYLTDESLASQVGAGAVLTFTFSASRELIWVRAQGGNAFAKVTGTPANSDGIYCEDGVPQPITVRATVVKVWAPPGVTVYMWGYA